jgi:hypothetical protein
MGDWKSDDQLRQAATDLADKIFEMYTNAGVYIPSMAPDAGGNPRQTFTDGLIADATEFMALDPQKIMDEFFRIQRAGRATGQNSEAMADLDRAMSLLGSWHGTTATEFAKHTSFIKTFMTIQESRLAVAAQYMGTAYSLTWHMRESYYNLTQAAIVACQKEIDNESERNANAKIATATEVVKSGLDLFTVDSVKAALDWTAQSMVSIAKEGKDLPLDSKGAEEVVGDYTCGRDQLRQSYEDALNDLRDWINRQDAELRNDDIPIIDPLPSDMHVTSPDFTYREFYSDYHDPSGYAPKVDAEREKYAQEHGTTSKISNRLDNVYYDGAY